MAMPLLVAQEGTNFYSVEKERALGAQLAAEFRKQGRPVSAPLVDAYVKRLGGELIGRLPERIFEYEFELIAGGEQVEPAPLPGGFIMIPLASLAGARDEAQLAGILAHAIAHAALRHGTRAATRGQLANTTSIPMIYMGGWQGAHAESSANGRSAGIQGGAAAT